MKPRASKLLKGLISRERRKRIEKILKRRTRYITVVLDNLYHPHNMSAVVRSCEAFGIQDLHAIEEENRFDPSHGIAMGAQRWISVIRHPNSDACATWLRRHGYTLFAADPPERAERTRTKTSYMLQELPLSMGPLALVFGKELDGLNPHLRNLCDATVYIPMKGFTESLNVSVTAAICLYELRKKLDALPSSVWQLSDEERSTLRDEWYTKSVRHGPRVLKDLQSRQSS